jgi:hypothetical protein
LWCALGSWHGLRSRVSLNLRGSKAAACAETPDKVQRFLSFPGTGDSRNKSLVTVVLLFGGPTAAWVSAQLVSADDWKTPALIALGFARLSFEDSVRKCLGNDMTVCFAKANLRILIGVLFRLPKLALSAQFAPVAPAPARARTVNELAEQPIFPSMSADWGGATLVSRHEG